MLDIKRILNENRVYWTDKGHNVAKGNINIKCPLCGPADKSEHLGIRLVDGWWSCWRDAAHSSKNINRLLAILNIYIVDDRTDVFQNLVKRSYFGMQEIAKEEVPITAVKVTKLPAEFIPIDEITFFTKPYLQYLENRGFKNPLQVCKDYSLRWSIGAGKWNHRLIIPTWLGEEVTWTARSINDLISLRYLSASTSEARNIKTCIFNFNELLKYEGKNLIIGEGPLDAIKADIVLKPVTRATCLFGLSITTKQIELLKQVCKNYDNIYICLDQGTLMQSFQLMKELQEFNPIVKRLPKKDLGEMNQEELQILLD